MEDLLYLNDLNTKGGINEAGVRYRLDPSQNITQQIPISSNPIVQNSINQNNNIEQTPQEADISIFKDTDPNIPDFFISNISESVFMVFIVTAALMASARLSNNYISFLLFCIICLFISTEYGISMAVVFYALFFIESMDIFVIILVVLALIHIFVPIPGLITESFNWNYVIETIIGILLLLSINNTWKMFCTKVIYTNKNINNNGRSYQSLDSVVTY